MLGLYFGCSFDNTQYNHTYWTVVPSSLKPKLKSDMGNNIIWLLHNSVNYKPMRHIDFLMVFQ